jgi:putative transposase
MIAFIDDQRMVYGVEPICKVLPIAPSTYFDHQAKRADPDLLSDRAKRDALLLPEIRRVHKAHFEVYGAQNVWRQLARIIHDPLRLVDCLPPFSAEANC